MPLPLSVSCFSKIQIGFTFLVLTHTCAKDQGQRSVVSKDRVETDAGDYFTSRANAVGNNFSYLRWPVLVLGDSPVK